MNSAIHVAMVLALCGIGFTGCNKPPAPVPPPVVEIRPTEPLSAPPEISVGKSREPRDLVFYVEDYRRLPDGAQSLRAAGTYHGRPLGFDLMLSATWQTGSLDQDISLVRYRGIVTYRSTGADSDAFVQVLDELYGAKVNPTNMAFETTFTGISQEGDPRDATQGKVKVQLSFESETPAESAELVANIDLANRKLEVQEKAPEYRAPIIRALQAR